MTADSTPNPSNAESGAAPAGNAEAAGDKFSFDALLEVSMPVIIEIGRTSMTLSDILQLRPGSVVQLDRMVGESVDIHVSDRKLAEGEVVVVGDHFGVRVTRVIAEPSVGAAA